MPEGRLPYPGLRAYSRDETDLFFGREGCVNEMVDRLAATRFLAVLGTSGSGKSSLVRTGLLDALELGLYVSAGSRWTIADCHPGETPLRNLAAGLLGAKCGAEPTAVDIDSLEAFFGRGPLAIIEWLADGNLAEGQNLLILVDQFEELFRYGDYAGREQAEAFVALLLESTRRHPRVHVTLTMRSEYLGACALIPGLAEQINAGLYLARRMTREECREAIVGPAAVTGFDIEPALVTRLLNDLSGFAPWEADREGSQLQRLSRQADQLPLMQHVLSRLWQLAHRRTTDGRLVLTLGDYIDIGELRGALEQHAGEVIAGLKETSRPFVRPLFRALVAGISLADAVRRPRPFLELVAVAGAQRGQVLEIVDAFRAPDCNFLRPSLGQEIKDGSLIDISHESLIRQWDSLSKWFDEEAEYGAQWSRLIGAEQRHSEGREGLPGGLTLANMAAWWDREQPNEAWALGHGGNYDRVAAFLARSREAEAEAAAEEKERAARERRGLRRRAAIYAGCALIAVAAAGYGLYNANVAEEQKLIAEQAAREAEEQKLIAVAAAKAANESLMRTLASQSQLELNQGRTSNAMKLALAAWPRLGETDAPQLRATADSLSRAMPAYLEKVWGTQRDCLAGAFSPDGTRIAKAMWDNTVRIWNMETGKQESVLIGHQGPVNHLAFSLDGKRIATSSGYFERDEGLEGDKTARVWDAETGEQLAVLRGHEGSVSTVAFSPDGRRVLTSSLDDTARVWDTATGKEIFKLEGHSDDILRATYSPDGKYVATASTDYTARVWDAATGAAIAKTDGLRDWVRWVAFSPDSRQIVTASDDSTARVWDTITGKQVALLQHTDYVRSAEFSPDGKSLVSAGDDGWKTWDTTSWLQRASNSETYYSFAAFSPDSTRILTRRSYDHGAGVWDAATGSSVASLSGHKGKIYDADFSPRGDRILTMSGDGTARLWDAISGELVRVLVPTEVLLNGSDAPVESPPVFQNIAAAAGIEVARFEAHSGPVYSVPFLPDGKTIVSASKDGTLRKWDVAAGAPYPALMALDGQIDYVSLSPDGKVLAVAAGDGKLRLFDLASGKVLREIATGHALMVSFSPDGAMLVTAQQDGSARLWNARTGAPGAVLRNHEKSVWSARFSKEGSRIVTASEDGSVRIWDVASGSELGVFQVADNSKAYFADFGPNDRVVAVGTEKTGVQIWSVQTKTRLAALGAVESEYYDLAFSPDGTHLAAAGSNGAFTVWDARTWVELAKPSTLAPSSYFSVAFSPDGSQIAAGDGVGVVRVIDISMVEEGDGFAVASQRLGSDTSLTDAQERYGLGELKPICGDHPPLPADPAAMR